MKIVELGSAERVPINIDARKLCVREDLELIHLEFAPGEGLDVHANPFDVVFFVVEGSGELEVGGERRMVTQDAAVEVPAQVMRGWKNTGPGRLRVLVIKALRK
ncbi:cupin domain-containing protein [Geomonas sp. RF6]|uniref:cupin domain-containing protein n=1 Tax=Geomonas sp. RF6 TaxID=2897342 RepID=UPI001E2FE2BB|nr:cupin domain-containing protein [Geomonas sp. RF6]UFS69405.1 cupin domain-containing protein [Geomonas sp. RF6]